jgi:murein DD-endopeptidase MepM/ murein hydrolase activator NlpD
MALPTAALPPVPTGIGAASPDIQKQYSESIDKVLAALENRGSSIPWFKISAAMADPGRTGSAAEGFGRAMGVLGQQRELEEQQALPVAQMRAQLVGQKYEMEKQAKALDLLSQSTGADPTQIGQMLTSGNMPLSMVNKFTPELMLRLSQLDPKLAAGVKDAAGMVNENIKNMLTMRGQGLDIVKYATQLGGEYLDLARSMGLIPPTTAAPVTSGAAAPSASATTSGASASSATPSRETVQVPAIFGTDVNAAVTTNFRAGHYGVDFAVPSGTPMAAPLDSTVVATGSDPRSGNYVTLKDSNGNLHTVAHLSEILVKKGQEVPMGSNFGLVGATGNATGPHAHWEIKNGEGKPVDPLKYFGISANAPAASATPAAARAPVAASTATAETPQFYSDNKVIQIPDRPNPVLRGNRGTEEWSKIQSEERAAYERREAERVARDAAQQQAFATQRGTSEAKSVDALEQTAKESKPLVQLADAQLSLIETRPKAFGYLNDPSFTSALLDATTRIQKDGFQVTPDRLAQYIKGVRDPEDLKALSLFAGNAIKINVAFANRTMRGTGPITEGERAMVALVPGSAKESGDVLSLKAEALKLGAKQDIELHDKWLKFSDPKTNPKASWSDFERSNGFKETYAKYDTAFKNLATSTKKLLSGGAPTLQYAPGSPADQIRNFGAK